MTDNQMAQAENMVVRETGSLVLRVIKNKCLNKQPEPRFRTSA